MTYWDFWQKQSKIPGQDCDTICGLLDSIKGKLDDVGGSDINASSGQLMAWINAPTGRICSWGIPLAESYGVRLPADYDGVVPEQMQIMDVPDGYELDMTPERVFYFYHDCERFFKYVRPVKKIDH